MNGLRAAWAVIRLTFTMGGALAGLLWSRRRAVSRFRVTLQQMGLPPQVAAQLGTEYAAILPNLQAMRRWSESQTAR